MAAEILSLKHFGVTTLTLSEGRDENGMGDRL